MRDTPAHVGFDLALGEKRNRGFSHGGGARACGTRRRKTEIPHGLRPGDTGLNPDSASYWLGEPVRQLKLPVQPAPSTAWRKDNTSPEGLCQSGQAGARRGLFDGLGRLSMLQCPTGAVSQRLETTCTAPRLSDGRDRGRSVTSRTRSYDEFPII